ncbi:MAG: hypothetical protein HY071_02920 [Chloroflexi bacterium]|nr:hypothetical protein [Chloroflexota bacterium]
MDFTGVLPGVAGRALGWAWDHLTHRRERELQRPLTLEMRSILFALREAAMLLMATSVRRGAAKSPAEVDAANRAMVGSWVEYETLWKARLPRYRELNDLLPQYDTRAERTAAATYNVGRRIGNVVGSTPSADVGDHFAALHEAILEWITAIGRDLGQKTTLRTRTEGQARRR